MAILAEEMFNSVMFPHQNRLSFSLPLSGACPDEYREASKRKGFNQDTRLRNDFHFKHRNNSVKSSDFFSPQQTPHRAFINFS